jgi:hypothetical protein
MKNNNFKSDNVNDIIKENGLNKIYKNDSSNLAKCILEYFYSENELNNFIKDKIKFKTLNIINKQWLDEFKNAVNYENIKDELSKIQNSAIYEQIYVYIYQYIAKQWRKVKTLCFLNSYFFVNSRIRYPAAAAPGI